ncbi:MAG: hypothetical protein K1Y02_16680 [Candidatus Hydrogenedentes bacterium]|nr:hypothetical protein [Candidatus Hydrogenedentota bacterium]
MTAPAAMRHDGAGLAPKLQALTWEECRVGGAIAATCAMMSIPFMFMYQWTNMPHARALQDSLLVSGVFAVPFLTALLLVFSPDYSGELVGGFSKRIMRLPIPTWAAVLVPLALRTVFVLLSAAVSFLCCYLIFGQAPGIQVALVFACIYLAIQTADWMRAPISGLSSALLLLALVVVYVTFRYIDDTISAVLATQSHAIIALFVFTACVSIIAYGFSVASVGAARVGRRVGIPEIWEWPQRITKHWPARSHAFTSPLSAQTWFELRRTAWIIPVVTFGVWALATFLISINSPANASMDTTGAVLIFGAFLLGAIVHGERTGVLGIRRQTGNPGFHFLQPLSDAGLAQARIAANLIAFVPALLLVLCVHYALGGRGYLPNVVLYDLAIGGTSIHEVIWSYASRGVFLGILAWAFLGIGTRTVSVTLVSAIGVFVVIWALLADVLRVLGIDYSWDIEHSAAIGQIATFAFVAAMFILTLSIAYRRGLLTPRALTVSCASWLLTAGLLFRAVPQSSSGGLLPFWGLMASVAVCLGAAALVPLPYVSLLLDTSRRRHSAKRVQSPVAAQTPSSPRTVLAYTFAACTAVFVVWLSWPAQPAFTKLWHSRGYPATLSELNAWYPSVPADRNMAGKYLAVIQDFETRDQAFFNANLGKVASSSPSGSSPESIADRLLIVGGADCPSIRNVPEDILRTTEDYWQSVTSHVAPTLNDIAQNATGESRYPVDLTQGLWAELSHLAGVREMSLQLMLDAFHWSRSGNSNQAIRSFDALLPLADSLAMEPILISQLTRISVCNQVAKTSEHIVNTAPSLSDADLRHLQETLGQILPPTRESRILDRGLVGESVIGITSVTCMPWSWSNPDWNTGHSLRDRLYRQGVFDSVVIIPNLLFSSEAERMTLLRLYDGYLEWGKQEAALPIGGGELSWENGVIRTAQFMSIRSAILAPAIGRSYESEWVTRMYLSMAQSALAAERYRLANGHLPESLDALVPAYLAEVPRDIFADFETPKRQTLGYLRRPTDDRRGHAGRGYAFGISGYNLPVTYRITGDDSFVIYSVGRNRTDNQGQTRTEEFREADDIAITIEARS